MSTLLRLLCRARPLRSTLTNSSTAAVVRRYLATGASTTTSHSHNKQTGAPNIISNVGKNKSKEWRTIYRLPLIRMASAFNRLKFYQAAITGVGTPAAFALEQAGHASAYAPQIFAIVGVTGLITLTLGSYFIKNLVGIIYINQAEDQLKLAYVDFWGRRQQTVLQIDELIPAWEISQPTRFSLYQPIQVESDKKMRYKLLQRFGNVTEAETFVTLFGE